MRATAFFFFLYYTCSRCECNHRNFSLIMLFFSITYWYSETDFILSSTLAESPTEKRARRGKKENRRENVVVTQVWLIRIFLVKFFPTEIHFYRQRRFVGFFQIFHTTLHYLISGYTLSLWLMRFSWARTCKALTFSSQIIQTLPLDRQLRTKDDKKLTCFIDGHDEYNWQFVDERFFLLRTSFSSYLPFRSCRINRIRFNTRLLFWTARSKRSPPKTPWSFWISKRKFVKV